MHFRPTTFRWDVIPRLLAIVALYFVIRSSAIAEEPSSLLPELIGALRTQFPQRDTSAFESTSVENLLSRFGATLASKKNTPENSTTQLNTGIYERQVGGFARYFRLDSVQSETVREVESRLRNAVLATNAPAKISLILDLRFASGNDHSAAARLADFFVGVESPLMDWGEGEVRSSDKTNAWSGPLMILVNRETSGSAEALAGVLRDSLAGLLIGSHTSGKPEKIQSLPLSEERVLRVPIASVRLGSGEKMDSSGLSPDIAVLTRPEHERAWIADPFTAVAATTNQLAATNSIVSTFIVRRKMNEAELVRAHRSGKSTENSTNSPSPSAPNRSTEKSYALQNTVEQSPNTDPIRDPVLGRAVDLLKALRRLDSQ